jgi:hypothetical protein
MKKILALIFTFLLIKLQSGLAQNVGIDNKSPQTKLHVIGDITVSKKYTTTTSPETSADSFTLANNSNGTMPINDSMVRIFDPGGPNNNYSASAGNIIYQVTNNANSSYIEISFDDVALGNGDAIAVGDGVYPDRFFYMNQNTSHYKGTIVVPTGTNPQILFTTNSDTSVSRGFNIRIRRIYLDYTPQASAISTLPGIHLWKEGCITLGNDNGGTVEPGSITCGTYNLNRAQNSFVLGTQNLNTSSNSSIMGEMNQIYTGSPGIFTRNFISGSNNSVIESIDCATVGRDNLTSYGVNSTVLGNSCFTSGSYKYLFGRGLQAYASNISNDVKVAVGKFNEDFTGGTLTEEPIFMIGCGTSASNRKNAMVVSYNGNIGAGINIPLAQMHIRSKAIIDQPASTGLASLEFRSNGAYRGAFGFDQSSSRFFFYDGISNTNTILIDNGKVGVQRVPTTNAFEVNGSASKSSAGSWLGNSDARLKTRITPITNALSSISKLQGITYEWNDTKTGITRPTGTQYGFTAQNIQQVFPNLVETDAQGYLQTAYGTYDALIIQAIKEQQVIIEQLRQEIEQLKSKK